MIDSKEIKAQLKNKIIEEAQLKNEITGLNNKLVKLEKERIAKELNRCVGKYYKLKNCYSDQDYWYEYLKVANIDKDNNLKCLSFRKDTEKTLEIQRNCSIPHYSSRRKTWTEITERKFTAEWKRMLSEINSYYK